MALNITRGKIAKAQKVVVYGPEGVGKTSFAAQFPNPLFIDTEGSTDHYDVARTEPPKSWSMLLAQVQEVKQTRPCSTLVIDTADWAETLCTASICAKNNWESIETPGFGAGYTALKEEFGKLLNQLSDLTEVGINVVLTAHAIMRKFEQPDEAASYDRWELKLQKKVAPIVKEWADAILFCNYKTIVETVAAGMGQVKGKARGNKRVMYAQHHACWDAKNRWGLGDELPFDYAQIAPFIPVPAAAPAPVQAAPAAQVAQQPAAAPAQAPAPAAAPSTASADELAPYFAPLLQLMAAEGISKEEIMAVCVEKRYASVDTPFENYAQDFVEGCLIAAWASVSAAIKNNVPF